MKEPPASMNGPILFFAAAGLLAGVFSARILRTIGFADLIHADTFLSVATPKGSVAPMAAFALMAAVILGLVAARRVLGQRRIRTYHTWDCGQPITPRMEYTATAFSAPIRFFFRSIVGIRKTVVVTQTGSGPLLVKREMTLTGRSFWLSRVYEPLALAMHKLGDNARRIQSGSIQLYLLFILIALGATLLIAV